MSAVTPGTSRRTRWASSSRSRCQTSTPGAHWTVPYLSGSSVMTTMRFTPSAWSERVNSGTGIAPAASWPPVIATAEL